MVKSKSTEINLNLSRSDIKKKKQLYGPFLWMGFNCLKATATSRREFTFYHPGQGYFVEEISINAFFLPFTNAQYFIQYSVKLVWSAKHKVKNNLNQMRNGAKHSRVD